LFLKQTQSIIRDRKINCIILSVGPFAYAQLLINLKEQFPNIKLIIDYRDYWEDGLKGLSDCQSQYELKLQKKVLESVDLILSPNREMTQYFSKTYQKPSYLLPHCYDTDDMHAELRTFSAKNQKKIQLIYGGAFYADIEQNIDLIKQFIDALSLHIEVQAEFYVSIKGFEKELAHTFIKRFNFIDSERYFCKVQNADCAILILPPNRVNAMSSKFFELIAIRKPILYFGGSGAVSEFLLQHQLGYHIMEAEVSQLAISVLENLGTNLIPNKLYDISHHTFEYQTKLLIHELENLK
jgi:hypothetical protein